MRVVHPKSRADASSIFGQVDRGVVFELLTQTDDGPWMRFHCPDGILRGCAVKLSTGLVKHFDAGTPIRFVDGEFVIK